MLTYDYIYSLGVNPDGEPMKVYRDLWLFFTVMSSLEGLDGYDNRHLASAVSLMNFFHTDFTLENLYSALETVEAYPDWMGGVSRE